MKNDFKLFLSDEFRKMLTRISPKLNTYVTYLIKFHRFLNLDNPQGLNEKILWLKFNTYWNNDVIKQCADKYKVRDYIQHIGCQEILNDLYAVYSNINEIEWNKLPRSFVMKLNRGCGYNIIVPDKSKANKLEILDKMKKWMQEKPWLPYSEMQYKDVKPYIIIEKYLKPQHGMLPDDYKFYCFNGFVPYVMVCTDRKEGGGHPKFWYFNSKWEMQLMTQDAYDYGDKVSISKPEGIEKAFYYASILSRGFPFVRVDLYIVDGKVYFGELTFTPSAGMDNGRLNKTDNILGDYLTLPKKRRK